MSPYTMLERSCSVKAVTLLTLLSSVLQLVRLQEHGDGCGYTLMGPGSGTVTSKNYPGTYPNHTWCEWQIQVSPGNNILLKFGDFDLQQCASDSLRIFKGISHSMIEYGTYCGNLNSVSREIYLDSNEMTIQFKSGSHISGRGFLLSYTTSNHPDLITCLDKGNHYDEPRYSKYCPAGCKAVIGDVSGDAAKGYRHTSLLCKAAIHAGVILDTLGGKIDVVQHKGLSRYEGILANGVLSKDGSLSEKRFVFDSDDCNQPLRMELGVISDGQICSDKSGQIINWFPGKGKLNVQGATRTTHQSDGQQWLEVDLGERKYITGIVTTGSTHQKFPFYVESYKVAFSKDRKKWKIYKESHSSVEKVFDGNTNYRQFTRNNFIPAIVGRYVHVIPQRWKSKIAVKMQLIGCQQVQTTTTTTTKLHLCSAFHVGKTGAITSYKPHPTQRAAILEKYGVNNTDPIVTKDNNLGQKLAATMGPIIFFVILLILGICIFRNLTNKKTEESFGTSSPPKSGCWKQFKSQFVRPRSTEFTISYSHEKEALQKLDVVRNDLSDYEQPLMVGAGTVARKGSTFKPIDTEINDGIGQTESMNHYVIPLVPNRHEYAEPLTNQEPEYATPIVETVRHLGHSINHSLSACTLETSYNVPVTTLTKKPSFSQLTSSTIESNITNCNGLHSKDEVYQIPQGIADCSKAEYDRPTCNSNLTAGEVVGTIKTQSFASCQNG